MAGAHDRGGSGRFPVPARGAVDPDRHGTDPP
jgi:hypothetical protein